jgi:RHS repeat-associated protein
MKFTGQRLDSTGLYYYGARYYDPGIGKFISADTIVPDPANPQSLNRYACCLNNPLKYIDPTGHWPSWNTVLTAVVIAVAVALVLAVVVVAAPVAVTALAGGAVLGTAAMAAGDVALVSIGSGLIAWGALSC